MDRRKYISFFLLLFSLFAGWTTRILGQNYVQDMEKVRESYQNIPRSFNMRYLFYPYDSLNIVSDSMSGKCIVNGSSYYYKLSNGANSYEYVKNTKYFFVVDYPNKAIAVKSSDKAGQDMWNVDKVDSMLKNPAIKVTYKSIDKTRAQYEMRYGEKTAWNRMRIVFDKVNYTLCEIWLYSQAKGTLLGTDYSRPRIGILYSNIKTIKADNRIFSEKRFFEDNGNGITLTEEYKKYKLLNYMKQGKKS